MAIASPKGGDRVTVTRHGDLVREVREYIGSKRAFDPSSETTYANLRTGASAQGVLRGPAERSNFTFRRETDKTRGRYRYELVQTGEKRTIAGEECAMWRADPLGERGGVFTGVARRACITSDGVVLYDAWLYRSGEVAEERTAIKVDRRNIAPGEVLPPKEAMNWGAWFARAKGVQPTKTGRPINYDLRLKQSGVDSDGIDLQRHRASEGWELREVWRGKDRSSFVLYHSSSVLSFRADSDSLAISFNPAPKVTPWDWGTEPLKRKSETVLGESCDWFNTTVHVFDYTRCECRSKDGIPLKIEEDSWGDGGPTNIATSLSRGKTSLESMMPPPALLRWADWGWPEKAR